MFSDQGWLDGFVGGHPTQMQDEYLIGYFAGLEARDRDLGHDRPNLGQGRILA